MRAVIPLASRSNVEIAELIHRWRNVMTAIRRISMVATNSVSVSTVAMASYSHPSTMSNAMTEGAVSMEMIAKHKIRMRAQKYRMCAPRVEEPVTRVIQARGPHLNVDQTGAVRKPPLLVKE